MGALQSCVLLSKRLSCIPIAILLLMALDQISSVQWQLLLTF